MDPLDPSKDLSTPRLTLHAVDLDEARRIVSSRPDAEDRWAPDYPFEGDIMAVTMFVRACEADGDQRPYGYYRITRRADGRAIGGIGFKGAPADGCVEVGYGLAPSARGSGFAAEALNELVSLARDLGLSRVAADTTVDNVASRRTLENAGFHLVRSDADSLYFDITLSDGTEPL